MKSHVQSAIVLTLAQVRILADLIDGATLLYVPGSRNPSTGSEYGAHWFIAKLKMTEPNTHRRVRQHTIDLLISRGMIARETTKRGNLRAVLTKAARSCWKHRKDTCECGDYRHQHVNGRGRCRTCAYAPANPLAKCQRFVLFKVPAREKLIASYPKELG